MKYIVDFLKQHEKIFLRNIKVIRNQDGTTSRILLSHGIRITYVCILTIFNQDFNRDNHMWPKMKQFMKRNVV